MKTIILKLDEEIYEELLKKAKEEGFLTISEYLSSLVLKIIEKTEKSETRESVEEVSKKQPMLEKLLALVERKVQDSINPFTQKVDDISRRIASLIEKLESLEERINSLEEKFRGFEQASEEAKEVKERKRVKKTAIDILKEQRVIFERDIASKIRDRDSFFAKLEREGAIVIEAKDERIAIDVQFWHTFIDKLKNIKTNNEEELKKHLDPLEFRVMQKLRESALMVFDTATKSWSFVI